MVLRYLVKQSSRCFFEGIFEMRSTFKSVNFKESRLLSIMWVGLTQSAEGMNRKKPGDIPVGTVVKNLPANAGDMGSSPGPGRSHMLQSN